MLRRTLIGAALSGALMLSSMVGCAIRSRNAEPSVIAASAASKDALTPTSNGVIGVLIGGVLGPDGGYLIAAQSDKTNPKFRNQAVLASRSAQAHPASGADVTHSDTADLNHDGYITLDEVIAIRDAGITDDALILRLKKANQVFELTAHQQNVLRDDAVSQRVIDAMLGMSTEVAGAAAADRAMER